MKGFAIAIAAAALLSGCWTKSPYDYVENWLIREDPARPFAIYSDLIYVQGDLYLDMKALPAMTSYAKSEVGHGRFNGVARVFSPMIANKEDLEDAMDWYFSHHHEKNRPFSFIGEGEGGAILKAYEEENSDWLKKKGLIKSYYTETAKKGFVNDSMVREIRNEIIRARYRAQWGREMPADMLKDQK